jgi:DNA-binding GntR family transcriptional regulator
MAEPARLGRGAGISTSTQVRSLRRGLSAEVARYVRELIISGQLRSGQALSIDALARELDTSTTPVREALLVLRGEGFVTMEPRRGFHVAPLTRQDVEDMFLVQSLLAGELAARATALVTDDLLAELSEIQERMRQADDQADQEQIELLNYEFHRAINLPATSPKLTWFLGVVVRYVPRVFYSHIPGWHLASLRDHEAVIEALRNRDAEAAREAMRRHISHAGALLVTHLENEGVWSTEGDIPAAESEDASGGRR